MIVLGKTPNQLSGLVSTLIAGQVAEVEGKVPEIALEYLTTREWKMESMGINLPIPPRGHAMRNRGIGSSGTRTHKDHGIKVCPKFIRILRGHPFKSSKQSEDPCFIVCVSNKEGCFNKIPCC
jgi:hypothetical protein